MKLNWLSIVVFAFVSCKKANVIPSSSYVTQIYNHKLFPADTFITGLSNDYDMPLPLNGSDSVLIDLNNDGKNDYILCAYHTYERVSNIRSQDHHYFTRLFGLDSTCQIAVTDCKLLPNPWISTDSVNCRNVDRLPKGATVNPTNTWDVKGYYSTRPANSKPYETLSKYDYITVGHISNHKHAENVRIGLRILDNSNYYYGYIDLRIPHFGVDTVYQLLLRKAVFNPTANESILIDS